MDSQNLQTASVYINNLLLSRGLLRNGKSIQFATPARDEGGTDATMAKIINLVHDLILRRDRDADQRENLAMTIREVRTTETKNTLELERLRTRNAETDRQLSIALGQERAFKATLRTAENAAKSLREEMQRTRAMFQQVRTQCANDIRKRDVQIQRLKTHITAQQRGTRPPTSNTTITISPNSALMAPGALPKDEGAPLDSSDYSLKQETTEFLTQLSQNLCDENDNLLGLVRASLNSLRTLQGLPSPLASSQSAQGDVKTADDNLPEDHLVTNLVQVLPTSYETLATEMDEVLEHLRTLLTNPSFVPLEEVEIREEEITRLREGWLKMEARWREAVELMDSWRKRMASGGSSVNLEELRVGLALSPIRVGKVSTKLELDDILSRPVESQGDESGPLDNDDDDDDAEQASEEDEENNDEPESQIVEDQHEESPTALGVGLQPDGRVLAETTSNPRPGRADATDSHSSNNADENGPQASSSTSVLSTATDELEHSQPGPRPRISGALPEKKGRSNVPLNTSRIPKQARKSTPSTSDSHLFNERRNIDPNTRLTSMTIEQKLAGARAENEKIIRSTQSTQAAPAPAPALAPAPRDAKRKRAADAGPAGPAAAAKKASKSSQSGNATGEPAVKRAATTTKTTTATTANKRVAPRGRNMTAAGAGSDRRRSTLSAQELASLIGKV